MRKACIRSAGCGALVLILSGCGVSSEAAGRLPESVQRGDLVRELVLTGELAAEDSVQLVAPEVPVRPLEIRWIAEDGRAVRRGDRLVEFDNSALVADLEDRRTQVQEAASQLAQARADAATQLADAELELASRRAEFEKAKLEAQVPPELVPALDYEQRQVALERSRLQLEQAQRELEARRRLGATETAIQEVGERKARLALQRSLQGIELLSLVAPRDGIFLIDTNFREDRQWQAGDSLWPGQTLARLPDLSSLLVRARLLDVDAQAVQPGAGAEVVLDAYPERALRGRVLEVEQVAQQAGPRSSRRFFGVNVALEGVDSSWMRPGMSVRVVLAQELCKDCLLAPRRCLAPAADPGAPDRARLASGGWVEVALGPCSDLYCAVEEGLDEGAVLAPAESPEVPS